ncbi:uncharacterized protein LAESUDRAFT_110504 [Laetiporus sulphureus 93-53]|uniref:Uncharacterized protein n=1 Tax=Laetiporus sulphureus 93-53 TaxID=1314785 RepID=A0A165ENZ0_9APHY|nr:uncharacterized protein LAESUDRAFT_110504 [Laetiporus sulphureus 93-53]KZT07459.1 hypothetical protein LAESUDRAFT_110504 [Laetiporus sulphureus 93-53]
MAIALGLGCVRRRVHHVSALSVSACFLLYLLKLRRPSCSYLTLLSVSRGHKMGNSILMVCTHLTRGYALPSVNMEKVFNCTYLPRVTRRFRI